MPRAVLFDFFNTLISGKNTKRRAVTHGMGADIGVDPALFAQMFTEVWPERMTGELGDLRAQIRTVAGRLGADPTEAAVESAVRRRSDLVRQTILVQNESVRVLLTLRAAGWRVAIVSNCTIDSAEVIHTTELARACDAVILSCEVGLAKPDPAIYRLACESVGAGEPAGNVFVGDGADRELRGADDVGMRAIQTQEFTQNDPAWTGERISTLGDLLPLLGVVPG
jgi:putative hydrolase of the HAD superfamily